MNTEHTPGPWSRADSVVVTTMETHHYMTWIANCSVGGAGSSEQLANARLVAAAPELLDALKDAIELIESLDGKDNSCAPMTDISDLRAIVAKATGVKP